MESDYSIQENSERLLDITNKVRLLGFDFKNSRIVGKMLVIVFERLKATITTLENIKDLSRITLVELLNSLKTQEQRRAMRKSVTIDEALPAKHEGGWRNKGNKNKQNQQENGEVVAHNNNKSQREGSKRNYPPCKHCNKLGHPPFKCWRRPDAKCNKCNQLGHEAVICRNQSEQQDVNQSEQQDVDAQFANEEDDVFFVATGFSNNISSASWLIDSGCTNHMTYDKKTFQGVEAFKNFKGQDRPWGHISVKGI